MRSLDDHFLIREFKDKVELRKDFLFKILNQRVEDGIWTQFRDKAPINVGMINRRIKMSIIEKIYAPKIYL